MTREEAITTLGNFKRYISGGGVTDLKANEAIDMAIEALKEVQKHEETFEWCHDCKEYDKENYCCHRWFKAIRNTVEELKADTVPIIPMEIKSDFRIDDCIYCSPKIVGNVEVVVRCKDCRWYEPKYKDKEYDCPQGLYAVYADDYCSHAERREP